MKKYIIRLSTKERNNLQAITTKGKAGVRVMKRALALLKSEKGDTDDAIAQAVRFSSRTVQRIRERYYDGGVDRAVFDAPRPGHAPRLTDKQEATLVAIACSDSPEGRTHWTIEMLREKLITDKVVDSISVGTIHARLTERGLKPWREKNVVYSDDER